MKENIDVDEQMGFSLILILRTLWKIKYRVLTGAVIGALIGLIVGVSTPKEYIVSVTLTPEISSIKSSGGLANMAASFLGTSFTQSNPDAVNALLAPEIVKSTPFLLEMLNSKVVDPSTGAQISLSAYLDQLKGTWWGAIMRFPGKIMGGVKSLFGNENSMSVASSGPKSRIINLSQEEMSRLNTLKSRVNATLDKQSSLISIHVSLQHPVVTAVVVDSMVNKLQKFLIDYKVSKAREDYVYWQKIYKESKEKYYQSQQAYACYVDLNSDMIFQKKIVEKERLQNEMNFDYQTYTQVAQQLQMAQSKVQEAKPSFTVVEPAVVPDTPIGMSKLMRMIVFAVIAMILLLGWELFIRDFLLDFKLAFLKD